LDREEYSMMEKMPLKIASVHKMCIIDSKFDQAIAGCLELLHELGHGLFRSRKMLRLQAIIELKQTIKKAKNVPAAKVIYGTLGQMTYQKYKMCMQLFTVLCSSSYQTEETSILLLSTCKLVQMTLNHGIAPESGLGLSSLALMALHVDKDSETASRIAEMALAVQKHAGRTLEGATLMAVFTFSLSWRRPLQACLRPLSDGYASSMRVGDRSSAMWALISRHIWIPYMIGKPLTHILNELPAIQAQTEELSQTEQSVFVKIFGQVILNLRSNSSHANKLEGYLFSRNEHDKGKSLQVGIVHFAEGELSVFLNPEEAADRAINAGNKFAKHCPSLCLGMIETFHRGVALYIMARRTRQRKYKVHARKIRKTVKTWFRGGNPNVEHYDMLLDAEDAALSRAHAKAKKLYLDAISLASKMGYLHHAALFNERYSDFLQHEVKDEEKAVHYLNEAIRFYEQWGATKKLKILEKVNILVEK